MSEMGRGSSLVAADVHYLLSLRELRYWILKFEEECLSNGAFLMHHVPKSVKYLYIEHGLDGSLVPLHHAPKKQQH